MRSHLRLSLLLAFVAWVSASTANRSRSPKYEYFDDYLMSITSSDKGYNQVVKVEDSREQTQPAHRGGGGHKSHHSRHHQQQTSRTREQLDLEQQERERDLNREIRHRQRELQRQMAREEQEEAEQEIAAEQVNRNKEADEEGTWLDTPAPLVHIIRGRVQEEITDDEDLIEGSGEETDLTSDEEDTSTEEAEKQIVDTGRSEPVVSDLDILGYFREVPREHWSCCMLGKLAGDKGFHCHAGFYAARLTLRNHNRAHNAKMLFHGPNRIPNWGLSIMRTFERCVARHSEEFHKCCFAASIEKRERHRWHSYREAAQTPQ